MHNQPGRGPTRQDKTTERMAQERDSPGATSAGGHAADAPNNDTSADPSSKRAGENLNTSANTVARRGASSTTPPVVPRIPED